MSASHEWEWMGHLDATSREEAAERADAEERKERDWRELSALAADFVKTYGRPALLRCISDAVK